MHTAFSDYLFVLFATCVSGNLPTTAGWGACPSEFANSRSDDLESDPPWLEAGWWDASLPYGADECDCSSVLSPVPRWSIRAGALALHRSRPDSAQLFFNFFDPTQGLDAASFDLGFKPAWEVSLGHRLTDALDFEIRYLSGDAWTSRAMVATDSADPLVINARTPIFLAAGRNIDATYGSDLRSFEANLRMVRNERVTWLVGFRYLELDEQLRADLVDFVTFDPTVVYQATTSNRLYGGQIGADVRLLEMGPRLWLDLLGKAAILGNANGQTSRLDTGLANVQVHQRASSAAFLGEAHLSLMYTVTPRFSLRLSYGALWITNLALATEQLNATSFAALDGIQTDGQTVYHGGAVGVEYRF